MSKFPKHTRDDPIPKKGVDVTDDYAMPELAEHIDNIDEWMAMWPLHKEQYEKEIIQYKDIETAFQHLDVMIDVVENTLNIITRKSKKGKKGGGVVASWESSRAFVTSRHGVDRQLKDLKKAKKQLEFLEIMKIFKRFERSVGTIRKNLVLTMQNGIGAAKEMKDDADEENAIEESIHPSLEEPVVGGEIYMDAPQIEEGEEGEDESLEGYEPTERPYYEVVGEWDEDSSLLDHGRVNKPIDLRKFPSLMEGGETRIAIDTARYGEDRTIIMVAQGDHIVDVQSHPRGDLMETTGKFLWAIDEWKPKVAIIETTGGLGAAIYDRLREMGVGARCRLVPLEVQGAPTERGGERLKAYNLRAEIYLNLEERLRNGTFSLPPDEELAEDLAYIRYKILSNGKIQILDKGEIKRQLGRSPDKGDCAAMVAWNPPVPTIYI